MRARFKLGNGDSYIIGFLQEDATVTGLGEAPDVIGAVGENVKVGAIGTHASEFAVPKGY